MAFMVRLSMFAQATQLVHTTPCLVQLALGAVRQMPAAAGERPHPVLELH